MSPLKRQDDRLDPRNKRDLLILVVALVLGAYSVLVLLGVKRFGVEFPL
jgi:hypothetical protein